MKFYYFNSKAFRIILDNLNKIVSDFFKTIEIRVKLLFQSLYVTWIDLILKWINNDLECLLIKLLEKVTSNLK